MVRIPTSLVVRTFLRSFALQGSWNFEQMQGLGALYTMMPVLKHYFKGKERLGAFRRHLGYFNTHPFMAPALIGTSLHHEAQVAQGEAQPETTSDYRSMLMAPYAAMGDALFWGGLRPLAAGVALFLAAGESVWAPVIFLLIFNLPHLWFRWQGLQSGCRNGLEAVEELQKKRLPDLAIRLKEGTVVLLGGLCAYLAFSELEYRELSPLWAFACLPLVWLFGWLARKGVSTLILIWIVVAMTTVAIGMVF